MFVRLWENHKKLVQPDSEKAYLYKSVYHEFLKFSRHQKTRDGYHQDYLYFYEPDDDNREHLEEIKIYLNKAIQKLPARCKEIFILNKIEGLTQKEIAGLLDISVKTVEHQVAKAIHKLRDELKPIMHLLPAMVILAKLLK